MSVLVVFLTLAFARFVSSVVVAGFTRAGCPYVPPPALEQVKVTP